MQTQPEIIVESDHAALRRTPGQKQQRDVIVLLVAVGVDYQGRDYVLQEGDEVSIFPPVQGG